MSRRGAGLTAGTVAGVSLAAAAVLLGSLSDALPFGAGSALAAERVFGSGRGVPPVWGALARWAWDLVPGAAAFRLGLVSALAGAVSAGAAAFAARRAFGRAVALAEDGRRSARVFVALAGPAAAFLLLSVPGVFGAFTHVGPFAVQLALVFLSVALVFAGSDEAESKAAGGIRVAAVGFAVGLAVVEDASGLVVLPFVAALAGVDAVWGRGGRPTLFVAFFALGLALAAGAGWALGWTVPEARPRLRPVLAWLSLLGLAAAVLSGFVRRRGVTFDSFVALAAALAAAGAQTVFCVRRAGSGRAADAYVRTLVGRLDGRRWLVSDGAFDALIRFHLPAGTRLVTYGRTGDRTHGEEIGRWVCEEVPDAGDDLLRAADLGPGRFVEAWLARPGEATNCVFATLFEPAGGAVDARRVAPLATCWRVEPGAVDADAAEAAWRAEWARMEPLLRAGDPAADLVRRRFAAHGNAVGTLLQEAGLTNRAWAAYAFARREMDGRNLSLLLNMDEMARRGLSGGDSAAGVVSRKVRAELAEVRDRRALRRRLAEGGRLFVPPDVRERLAADARERRRAFWGTPTGRLLRAGFDRLDAAEGLEGAARAAELDAVVEATASALGDPAVSAWVRDLFLGRCAQLRGREGLAEARRRFRAVVDRGEGDYALAFDRLLAVGLALGDRAALEDDALRVLRCDPGHAAANALAGSARLARGDAASALRFLRSAERLGLASAAVLNDLALALSWQGRHAEAHAAAERAVAAAPDNPHVRATLDEVDRNGR